MQTEYVTHLTDQTEYVHMYLCSMHCHCRSFCCLLETFIITCSCSTIQVTDVWCLEHVPKSLPGLKCKIMSILSLWFVVSAVLRGAIWLSQNFDTYQPQPWQHPYCLWYDATCYCTWYLQIFAKVLIFQPVSHFSAMGIGIHESESTPINSLTTWIYKLLENPINTAA